MRVWPALDRLKFKMNTGIQSEAPKLSDSGYAAARTHTSGQAAPKASHCDGQARLPRLEQSDCGQVMIFLLMALLVLAFAIIWNFDLHNVIHLKMRSQNAADASALAAARWQGITLNMIGDLNIMQAMALSCDDAATAGQITEIQKRLCFVGPLMGLLASQQAAKNNGIYNNSSFSERLAAHADGAISDYSAVFAPPYENCWNEYGAALASIAASGVAAGPDNSAFYTDYTGGHILLTVDFYNAVAGKAWCWFFWNTLVDSGPGYYITLLNTYVDYESWPSLPPRIPESNPGNSEIFGLGLNAVSPLLGGAPTVDMMNQVREARNLGTQFISNSVITAGVWFCYQSSKWSDWAVMKDPSFPVFPEKQVKPQYDYAGADAVTRVEAFSERIQTGTSGKSISSTAAAKPFGFLTTDPGTQIRPDAYGLVLPAFYSVRLIPVDSASMSFGGAYDLAWRDHIENHLPVYMENGPAGLDSDCWYCQQLIRWEDGNFRQEGSEWLNDTNNVCVTYGPGPGSGGGTRRGH